MKIIISLLVFFLVITLANSSFGKTKPKKDLIIQIKKPKSLYKQHINVNFWFYCKHNKIFCA